MSDVYFAVCGYALPEQWRQRWSDPRIKWLGFVPDLTVEQQASAVFLAALREGGLQPKVLEALAAGLPLVSTSQGVSGLALTKEVEYACADTTDGLAEALIQVLNQPKASRRMGEAGRNYAVRHHDRSAVAQQLEDVYRKMVDAHWN